MRQRITSLLVVGSLGLVGCGGGSDSDSDSDVASDAAAVADPSVPATVSSETVEEGPELPTFASDFDRVCTTQVGFAGATPLSTGPGPRPMVLFQETDSGILITSSLELPAGWLIDEDTNFDDNSDLAPAELIGCSQISAKAPNGTSCDLEDDDGNVTTLDLVDITYELTVYEATTGTLVGTETIEAASTDCPFFVFLDEGDTQYFNTPDADQYTNALKAYITP